MRLNLATSLCAVALTLTAMPAAAQDADAAATPPASEPVPADVIAPERIAAGHRIAMLIMPPGSYGEMMSSTFRRLGTQIVPMMAEMEAATGDKDGKMQRVAATPGAAGQQIGAMMNRMMVIMGEEMAPVIDAIEPRLRQALGQALARRHDSAQLQELERFMITPTGAAFARGSLTIWTEPAVLEASMSATPAITERMPAIMARFEHEFPEMARARQEAASAAKSE